MKMKLENSKEKDQKNQPTSQHHDQSVWEKRRKSFKIFISSYNLKAIIWEKNANVFHQNYLCEK